MCLCPVKHHLLPLICVLSFLVNLGKGLPILFVLANKHLFVFLSLCCPLSVHFIDSISALHYAFSSIAVGFELFLFAYDLEVHH